ncbi:hypothetical protein KBC75_00330 [Candidatus Shapirobacteria bacterium]|nr:hypothetical protein [Candidatus Shapirobacteria bacterium]
MQNINEDLTHLLGHRVNSLPESINAPEKLAPLLDLLPKCPYHILNRIGSIIADLRPGISENRAKGKDIDLTIPVLCCSPEIWTELQPFIETNELEIWGENDALVTTNNVAFFLHPKYLEMDNNLRQQKVCELFQSQIPDPHDSQLHKISTGETIVYVGPGISDSINPKKDFPSPYAEVYPVFISETVSEEQAYQNLGYLPNQGKTVISTSGRMYGVSVSHYEKQDFNPDLSAYASLSPNHAILFLRRLTKSTIATLRHSRNSSTKEKRLQEFHHYYSEVMEKLISPHELNQSAQDSLNSLARKTRKLEKLEKKFIQASAHPIQLAQ